jgi:UDP-N-acetylmuramoyl-tripeptide--D-alanyl-D-alanine ligase
MKFLQQENYFNKRFLRFSLRKLQLIDTHVSIPLAIGILAFGITWNTWWFLIPVAALVMQIAIERNPVRGGIKPLATTARAKRIFWTAFGLWGATLAANAKFLGGDLFVLLTMVAFAPAFLVLANLVLVPIEKLIQRKYISEAKEKLKKYNPTIVGITGSFGKTSVKNILQHILNSYSSSFATKRSINTLMGIVRVIREEMNQPYKYFVAEMGIGDRGQMPRLLRFINPQFGIITAIGAAHLENFKTLKNVAKEKFRLSKWVAKNGGGTILAAQNIAPEFIEKYKSKNDIIFFGSEIESVRQTIDGLSFSLNHEGKKHKLFAPIYGIHQAENIAVSFILARMLGVSAENIILALKTLKQTEHRLEVRKEGNLLVIDDAFNSNIKGFLSALETGAQIKGANRFILITPGMVELGKLHGEQHKAAGQKANDVCDIVIAVKPERIKDFTNQISDDKLVTAQNLNQAREWLSANEKPGDVVLYENDLPDVYIEKIRI